MKKFNISYDFSGNTVLVTGGNTGIGYITALLFAQAKANVILLDVDSVVCKTAEALSKKTGMKTLGVVSDITDWDSLQCAKKQCLKVFPSIDILVNNAGVGIVDAAEKLSIDDWNKTITINLTGNFFVTKTFVPEMIKRKKGKIVNLASQAAVIALDKHVAYCPSKAGVVSMTRVMALEWGKYNINVNAVSPTITNTEMTVRVWSGKPGNDFKKKMPISRFAEPEEIGATILFLSSNASDMIHGENILVDGGYSIQ